MHPETALVDVVVIGAGIVGLAVAEAMTDAHPTWRVVVLEKEEDVAAHQTGRNSGVLHSGIYYKPGSMKALTAKSGRESMVRFCQEHGVEHDVCGKVIVAADPSELDALAALDDRGRQHGLSVVRYDRSRLAEVEPHAEGMAALFVPETGIVDFVGVCRVLARHVQERGGEIRLATAVVGLVRDGGRIVVETTDGSVSAGLVVNCGGLQSDRVAGMLAGAGAGAGKGIRIVPFRGEYFDLVPERAHLVRNLIYPVPDPRFPFLGVHLTRSIHGGAHAGPNAVLALAREGYRRRDVRPVDTWEMVRNPAMRKLARRYWRVGLAEMHRSFRRDAFVKALQRLVPEIRREDLRPARSGVRAQAIDPSGILVDDFLFADAPGIINVLNAPSPAATAALEIGRHIVARAASMLSP